MSCWCHDRFFAVLKMKFLLIIICRLHPTHRLFSSMCAGSLGLSTVFLVLFLFSLSLLPLAAASLCCSHLSCLLRRPLLLSLFLSLFLPCVSVRRLSPNSCPLDFFSHTVSILVAVSSMLVGLFPDPGVRRWPSGLTSS